MEQDRFELVKTKFNTNNHAINYFDVDYLIKEIERLRALLANYDDNYCKVWHIGDVLGDK